MLDGQLRVWEFRVWRLRLGGSVGVRKEPE